MEVPIIHQTEFCFIGDTRVYSNRNREAEGILEAFEKRVKTDISENLVGVPKRYDT